MPIHTALADCQLTPTTGLPSLNWARVAEATGASSPEILSPPKQMVKPYHPRCSLSHHRDSADDENSLSSPGDNSESSSSRQKPTVKGRKRIQARPVKKSSGNTTDADGTPAADTGKINKAYLRGCHNKVEKKYRDRLNNDFNMLLDVLSDYMDKKDLVSAGLADDWSRGQSKGSILRLARWKLQALKAENRSIASELETFRRVWAQWQVVDMTKPPHNGL